MIVYIKGFQAFRLHLSDPPYMIINKSCIYFIRTLTLSILEGGVVFRYSLFRLRGRVNRAHFCKYFLFDKCIKRLMCNLKLAKCVFELLTHQSDDECVIDSYFGNTVD